MVWFFERDGESFEIETRFDNEAKEYVLTRRHRRRAPETERFTDVHLFGRRLETLEKQLEAEHWVQRGPVLLHDGWKI
jgi:hypothetical protein